MIIFLRLFIGLFHSKAVCIQIPDASPSFGIAGVRCQLEIFLRFTVISRVDSVPAGLVKLLRGHLRRRFFR